MKIGSNTWVLKGATSSTTLFDFMNDRHEMHKPSNQLRRAEIDQDRISNLPSNAIDQILSRLNIRDAARTSVLSSKWRYKWAELPYIVLDYRYCPFNTKDQFDFKNFASIVDHVLLLHRGPILKFEMFNTLSNLDKSAMDRWIMHLSRSPIKELALTVWGIDYCVPYGLFSLQSLTHLFLDGFTFKLPSTFKGFTSLKSLVLDGQEISKDDLENLISRCPVLVKLDLKISRYLSHVTISAPNLLVFYFEGKIGGISFEHTSRLADVSILSKRKRDLNLQPRISCSNLLNFCVQLPMIRKLKIDSWFLKYLSIGVVPGKLPTCATVNYLTLIIDLNKEIECLRVARILSVFPNLLTLRVDSDSYTGKKWFEETKSHIWEENCLNFRFAKLEFVDINNIIGTQGELDFVKFMLSISPVLEEMVVTPDEKHVHELKLIYQLSSFRRASGRARIIYPDPETEW